MNKTYVFPRSDAQDNSKSHSPTRRKIKTLQDMSAQAAFHSNDLVLASSSANHDLAGAALADDDEAEDYGGL